MLNLRNFISCYALAATQTSKLFHRLAYAHVSLSQETAGLRHKKTPRHARSTTVKQKKIYSKTTSIFCRDYYLARLIHLAWFSRPILYRTLDALLATSIELRCIIDTSRPMKSRYYFHCDRTLGIFLIDFLFGRSEAKNYGFHEDMSSQLG
jgi:hypothetical protein